MKAFLIVMLVLLAGEWIGALLSLLADKYPRTATYGRGYDCANAIANLALFAWVAFLLWGGAR